jgi:hypothetical protein
VSRERREAVLPVKGHRGIVDRHHLDRPHTELVRKTDGSLERLEQEPFADPSRRRPGGRAD